MAAPVYATPAEYAEWLNPGNPGTPPAGAERALRAASRRIRTMTMSACYETDETGAPTNPDILAAFMEATCAQADYARGIGDKNDTGAALAWGAVKLGSASMSRGQAPGGGTEQPSPYSGEAYTILQQAGLIPAGPTAAG